MIRAVSPSYYSEFWPTGWLIYVSIALGVFDVAMLANLVRLVAMR